MIASVVHPHCIKVLPTVYSNSLSYYEEICQFRYKLNEVIEAFNEYEAIIIRLQNLSVEIDDMLADINSIKTKLVTIDGTLENLQNQYLALQQVDANLQSEIDTLKVELNKAIVNYNTIINYVDRAIAGVEVENSTAWTRLENYINVQNRMLQLQIDELEKQILPISQNVYNPVRGVRESFDDNTWDIYQDLRYGGFTNAELASYGIDNDTVAGLVHDNRDYALNAKERFKRHYLFSPVTGKEVSHANAISQVLSLLTHGLTNEEFANLDKTNDEVAEMNLTNIEKFLYYEGDSGITVGEYDSIIINNIAGILSVQSEV